jgi:outer membrane protein assembly factor BamA
MGVMAFKTENDSRGFGGAALLHVLQDRWRYKGALMDADVNLDFYTPGTVATPQPIGYNVDGVFVLQEMARRLGGTHVYLGGRWVYIDVNVTLDQAAALSPDFAQFERSSALGIVLEYDGRDSIFTPSSGWSASLTTMFFDDNLGSQKSYQKYTGQILSFWPLMPKWVLGTRFDVTAVDGEPPFYQLPSIRLRGIPYGRFVGENAGVVELEARWDFKEPWAVVLFAGGGRAWGRNVAYGDASTHSASGVGGRYRIAKKLGLYIGADYAWGPEDEYFYVTIGNAWY